jgi:hypothetical protein
MTGLWLRARVWLANKLLDISEAVFALGKAVAPDEVTRLRHYAKEHRS